MPTIDYACEHNDVPCREYRVTDHDGNVTRCVYCEDCAALASIDWNGETASIAPLGIVDEDYALGVPGRACLDCKSGWPLSEGGDHEGYHHAAGCAQVST